MPASKKRKPEPAKARRGRPFKRLRMLVWLLGFVALAALCFFRGYWIAPVTTTFSARSCWNNLSFLGAAVQQCAFEGKLDPGTHVLMKDLLERGFIRAEPLCYWGGPTGGKYPQTFIVGEKILCPWSSVAGHDAGLVVSRLGPFRWERDAKELKRVLIGDYTCYAAKPASP